MQQITINKPRINAIDQTAPHPSVSKRYKFVSTREVLNVLEGQGFVPEFVKSRSEFGLHLIKLSHPDLPETTIAGSLVKPQIWLKNSHDRSASFGLIAGAFRFACFNGLILGHGFGVNLIHTGNIKQDLNNTLPHVFESVSKGIEQMRAWSQVQLTETQIRAYVLSNLDLRLSDKVNDLQNLREVIDAIVRPMRPEDFSNDLFTVYNRLQSVLIRGSIRLVMNDKVSTLKKISGARSTLSVNQSLSNRTNELFTQLTKGA